MNLKPLNDCVVVELLEDYEYVDSPDKQFNTKNKGIVTDATKEHEDIVGKKVYFASYQDDITEIVNGKKYSAIPYKEIRMYEQN